MNEYSFMAVELEKLALIGSIGKGLANVWKANAVRSSTVKDVGKHIAKLQGGGQLKRTAIGASVGGGLGATREYFTAPPEERSVGKALIGAAKGGVIGGATGALWAKGRLPFLRRQQALMSNVAGHTANLGRFKGVYQGRRLADVAKGSQGLGSKVHNVAGELGLRGWTGTGVVARYLPVGAKSWAAGAGVAGAKALVAPKKGNENKRFSGGLSGLAGGAAMALSPALGWGSIPAYFAADAIGRSAGSRVDKRLYRGNPE